MPADETELVAMIRTGDAAALARFVDQRRRQLLAFIDQRTGAALRSRVEIEDILQDAIVAALRGLPKTDMSERDPFSWLCQLAEERIVDRAREFDAAKRDLHREVSGHAQVHSPAGTCAELIEMLAASMTSVTKAVVRNERQARMQECIEHLPPATQEILRLRYVEGRSTREIADSIGKSDGAVRVLLSRTLQEIQQIMGISAEFD